MEDPQLSVTPEKYWTDEKERVLISFFSKHSCLWNHKSESYKNRNLRWQTLEDLRNLLADHPPPVPFTVEEIKNKFKNLRTTFQRQYKVVKARQLRRPGAGFLPQWRHYEQMMFLQGCWDQDDCPDDQPPSPSSAPLEEEEEQPDDTSFLPTSSSSSSPSCVPNMMVRCYWTEERERALITFYSKHHCLWNKKSENHNNRRLRLKLLEELRSQLSDHSVTFSVGDVKCKFKNLRTVFHRENKSVQASLLGNRLYASKWKHFQQMLFLCESGDEDDCPDDLRPPTPQEKEDQTSSSSSTQIKSGDVKTSSVFLPVSPDNIKLESQETSVTFPCSPSTDCKPCRTSSPPNVCGSVQPDGQTSSTCLWTEDKVQQLISFYSDHGCLWDHRSESYRNRLLRQSLLETLSSLLSDSEAAFTVDEIKTKFRNLRTTFQREHKAVSANQTCGSEDFYLPRWKHYQELMFLSESCDEDDDDYHGNQTAAKATAEIPEAPPSPTPPDSQRSSPSSSTSSSSSRVSGGRKRAGCRLTPSGDLLDAMRTFCQSKESPHAGFLQYVEECLNETPPDKVRKLKKKIIETIHSAAEEI